MQDTTAAAAKWGDIGDWDVSGVKDFRYAFSTFRNEAGARVGGGNPKAVTFVGTGMSKWITTSLTDMTETFRNAAAMNADLASWSVVKVVKMEAAFSSANQFAGKGLESWITSKNTNLHFSFMNTWEMNADLSGWNVAKVSNFLRTFNEAKKFTGTGVDKWIPTKATEMREMFRNTNFTSCNKRKIADAWKGITAFDKAGNSYSNPVTTYETDWVADTCPFASCPAGQGLVDSTTCSACASGQYSASDDYAPCATCAVGSTCLAGEKTACSSSVTTGTVCKLWSVALTDEAFKQASWDWVQNTGTATSKWGVLGDWDMSGVKDLSYSFSTNRNEAGAQQRPNTGGINGNLKAATFVGTGMSKWITTSLTSLVQTFSKAVEMNADLSGWMVAKVTTMKDTFNGAKKFAGTGLATWITTSVTTLERCFHGFQFEGAGLSSWDTAKVTSLSKTLYSAPNFNADLTAWKVAKVTTLEGTFDKTLKFEGRGLSSWDTSAVTNLKYTFLGAAMNVDLSGWDVSKVKDVNNMVNIFKDITKLSPCNKRKIADKWKVNAAFDATTYDTDWPADKCLVRSTLIRLAKHFLIAETLNT